MFSDSLQKKKTLRLLFCVEGGLKASADDFDEKKAARVMTSAGRCRKERKAENNVH